MQSVTTFSSRIKHHQTPLSTITLPGPTPETGSTTNKIVDVFWKIHH